MKNNDKFYKCIKCKRMIDLQNQLLHDQFCTSVIPYDEEIMEKDQYPSKEEVIENKQKDENILINLNTNFPTLEEIRANNPPLSKKDELLHCELCDSFLSQNEYEDHMMCHKVDMDENPHHYENLPLNPLEELRLEKLKSGEINWDDYEIIDKDRVVSEMEEEEAYQRKFAQIKKKKKKGNVVTNKIIPYLFDTTYRRRPPIARLCKFH
jgi:hypothetical protein